MSEPTAQEAPAEATETPSPKAPDAPRDETPEQTIAALREALTKANNEAKTNRIKATELDRLKAEQMSDLERAQAEADALRNEVSALRLSEARKSVALAKGLPPALVERLRGDTEEDMAADADALLALVSAPRTPSPDPTQGPQGAAPMTPEQQFVAFAQTL